MLTQDKIEEIRLGSLLGAAYQRLFIVEGEIARLEVEAQSFPVLEDLSSDEGKASLGHSIYRSALIGRMRNEKERLVAVIAENTAAPEPPHSIEPVEEDEKSPLEWFREAKAAGLPWADAAIDNYTQQLEHGITDITSSHSLAWAVPSFVWHETPEGVAYWLDIHQKLMNA